MLSYRINRRTIYKNVYYVKYINSNHYIIRIINSFMFLNIFWSYMLLQIILILTPKYRNQIFCLYAKLWFKVIYLKNNWQIWIISITFFKRRSWKNSYQDLRPSLYNRGHSRHRFNSSNLKREHYQCIFLNWSVLRKQ